MSERTVSENNKLWEAAEKMAEKAVANAKAENEEERRKQKKRLTKIILMMVLIALIMIFASIAWFAMNKAVTADTMAIEAKDSPFEIATKGSKVRYETEFSSAESDYTDGEETNISGIDHITSSNKQQIRLRYDPTEQQLKKEDEIGPNSSGKIELYIVPKETGPLTVNLDLSIVAYSAIEKKQGETTTKEIIKMSNLTPENSGMTPAQISECVSAQEFLNGHILFFEEQSSSSAYSYEKPISSGVLEHSFNAQKDVPEKIIIYWTWTNTLGQIALKNNDSQLRNGIPVVKDSAAAEGSDKRKVINYLKDNKEKVFKHLDKVAQLTDEEKEGKTEEQLEQAYSDKIDQRIEDAADSENFTLLSEGYNSADFTIGTSVDYFIVEIAVSKGQ